ncbi:VOC family protein [Micromonospora sp. DT47]|uniref:VOC family protein n=1 Tax=Micromonospora sp. DT47 TaxID=3393431 RepID=UPI003CECB36C
MALSLSHTTFDAHDPHAIAEFWRQLLTWDVQEPESPGGYDDPSRPASRAGRREPASAR